MSTAQIIVVIAVCVMAFGCGLAIGEPIGRRAKRRKERPPKEQS